MADDRIAVPWDFELPVGDGTDIPNEPSAEGAKFGEPLARLADRAELVQRQKFPNMLPRCNDCAFRKGTLPNRCLTTVLEAFKCVVEGKEFFCHKGIPEGGEPSRWCSGWAMSYSAVHATPEAREGLARLCERLRSKTRAGRKRRRREARARR